MRRTLRLLLPLAGLLLAPLAIAGPDDDPFEDLDDEEFEFEDGPVRDEDEEIPALPENPEPPPDEDEEADDEEVLDFVDDGESDDTDLLEDEQHMLTISGDSAEYFREQQEVLGELPWDEEVQGWEAYLAEYPATPFHKRITARVDELMDKFYAGTIEDLAGPMDAMRQEIRFTQPLTLENIDPRTRFQVGFAWGVPTWLNLYGDYEHALVRSFSLHARLGRRFTGYNFESGFKWALVKSTRTTTLLTLMADFHLNLNPTFPAARPMLAFGKRLGHVDVQFQGGSDLEFRDLLGVRLIGGANVTYRAADMVWLFAETSVHLKDISRQDGHFRFNTATVGMKFFPRKRGNDRVDQDVDVNIGAEIPYSTNYYSFHFGSAIGQANFYL